VDIFVAPPTFSLAPQWLPHFFILESPLFAFTTSGYEVEHQLEDYLT